MPIQDTSIKSFKEILESIGKSQQVVYDAIKTLACPTDMEIVKYLGFTDPNKVRPRRNELVKKGLIVQYEKRECIVTHKTAIAWSAVKIA